MSETLSASANVIPVGIGELHATDQHDIELVAYGLGSCVGVVVYDEATRAGGMVHVLLPERSWGCEPPESPDGHARYADTGIRKLLDRVTDLGASRRRLVAKIAGGARMFQVPRDMDALDIGARNAEAVRVVLAETGVPIVAQDVGGTVGRTMRYLVGPGKVYVRGPGMAEKEL
jgi:chemotaxis protein CheD